MTSARDVRLHLDIAELHLEFSWRKQAKFLFELTLVSVLLDYENCFLTFVHKKI